MSILAKTSVLLVIMFLMLPVTVDGTDEPRYKILKFGHTEDDYVMFTHNMSQFETGFTLCTWVRKLYSQNDPTWFSYAVSGQQYELGMTDKGTQTSIFGDRSDLTSYYTVTPGTWFHNCLSWDSATSTRDVYIDGLRVNGKATPAGRTLGQEGAIVLGNEQHGVGTGMDSADIFGGEIFKLNMFTRKLSDSEIKEMSEERCSVVEMKYGEERGIKWKDVLQKTKNGNVVELEVDSQCKSLIHVWHNLQIAAIAGYKVLKFGQNVNDYVMFQHDMSQFETGFTVCSWVRKLRNVEVPTWFSYAVSNEEYEIQISDMGDRTRIFGVTANLARLYTVTPGTWFHNCLSWDSNTSTRNVYIDGVRIDSATTTHGRTLGQGGTIVLGNEQQGVGRGMDSVNILSGELFKLNMFTRKLDESEIKEMSIDMCSEVETKYGDERGLKWEDVLQKTRYGYVTEISIGPQCKSLNYVWNKLQETDTELNNTKNANVEQENAITELNNTFHKQQNDIIELNSTIREEKSSILQLTRKLNNTINGYKVLKFGQTENDYIMFQHDMSEFETGFTVCSWVRKLRNVEVPTWFSYAVSNEKYEIQISDMGDRTRIFGVTANLASLYTVTPGTWFHNCLSWDSTTSTRDVYIDGVRIDSASTPAGRALGQGGTIVLGNEQDSGPGLGMDSVNILSGELFKLNMFTRKLDESEIKEMSIHMCSEVEMKYERGIKWEDVLKKSKNGIVTEISIGPKCKSLNYVWKKLQETDTELNNTKNANVEQENAITELNNTIFDEKNKILAQEKATSELNNTIHKQQNDIIELKSTIREEKSSILKLTRKLNNTINGYKVLKFGQTENDYIMFQHDMSEFETGFTVCSWVRKLRNVEVPTWFSYAVSNEKYEIQISDMGDRTRIFGVTANLASLYTVTPGTWFHNCLSWDSTTSTRNVYIDGVRIDSAATPAGRTLRQGGIIVLGNEQDSGPGLGMDSVNILSGELFKLNMFTRKLDESEIKEMSIHMCSEVEMKYGDERGLKWEDILQKTKHGDVAEIIAGPQCKSFSNLWSKLEAITDKINSTMALNSALNETILEQKNSIFDMNNTILEMRDTNVEQQNSITELNSTIVDEKIRNLEQKKAISKLNITILEEKSKIAEQENAISELNNTILEDIGNMVEHTDAISELNGTMIEEKSKIAEQENEINEQRTSLTELNMTIFQQKSRMDEQKRVVKKMNNTIVEEKTKVLEQKKLISDLNVTILAEKLNRVTDQKAITGLNKTLLDEMIKILEQKSAIAELNNTILEEKNLNIAQQSVIAKLNNTIIDEKSKNVAQQDDIAELNSTILEVKGNNVAQKNAIVQLDTKILEEKKAITALNSTILEEKDNIVAQQDAITELNSTILEEKDNNVAQQDAITELNNTILEEKGNNVAQQDAITELNSTILEEKGNNVAQQDAIAELNSTILEVKGYNVAQQDAITGLNSTILQEMNAIKELNNIILGLKNVVDDRKNAEVQKNVTQTQLQGKIQKSLFKFSLF